MEADAVAVRRLAILAFGAVLVVGSCGSPALPAETATSSPVGTLTTPSPTPRAAHELVYLAQDRLPPVAVRVPGAGLGATAEERVLSRVRALFTAASRPPLFNVAATSRAWPIGTKIDGDTATVDFAVPSADWGVAGSAGVRAFVQQLTYTITEEPGIRQSLITENGAQAIIGGEGLVIDHAVAREDVSGFGPASTEPLVWRTDRAAPVSIATKLDLDGVAPGVARFVVDTGEWGAKASIGLNIRAMRTDERAFPDLGKWTLAIAIPDATTSDETLRIIDRTPVRAIHRMSTATGVRYEIGLDDLRPWRVAMLYEPLRLVVDIGGDPDAVSGNIGLYQPVFGSPARFGDEMSGLIRAFEGQFEYAITDATGAVTIGHATASLGTADLWGTFRVPLPELPAGHATLEVRLLSPKDGSVSERVWTSFEIAP